MVSPANTNPGLTKKWDPGEPNKYYPTGIAQLRPRRRHRRHPGPGGRPVDAVARAQEGLRAERQADLRLRRREHVPSTRRRSSASRSSASRAGTRSSRATRRSQRDQGIGRAGGLPRRHRVQQRREADAGHQGGQSEDPAADAGRLQRSGRERCGRERRVHQRRRRSRRARSRAPERRS